MGGGPWGAGETGGARRGVGERDDDNDDDDNDDDNDDDHHHHRDRRSAPQGLSSAPLLRAR